MTGALRHRWRTSVLVAAILLWSSIAQIAVAHGGGTPRLTNEAVGPYRLYAWSEPEPWRVGEVHLSLMVTRAAGSPTGAAGSLVEEPVTDADLTVSFVPNDPLGTPITVEASPSAQDSLYYEADTVLAAPGPWSVSIGVGGTDGGGTASFDVMVLPAQTANWWLVGGAGGVLLILVVLAGLWSRSRPPSSASKGPAGRRRASHT